MPSELYEHDLIIGASSQGGIVSIHDLRAGTILVDDSFPHCFDPSLAHERMDGRKDVVVVGGGLLDFPSLEFVPDPGLAHWQADLDTMMPRSGLPGCAVGALIDEPSLGLVDTLAVKKAWQATIEGGLTVPPLHLDTREVSPDVLKYVSKLRGGS